MSNYAISLRRTTLLLLALAFTAVLTIANLSVFSVGHADAAQLSSRSLTLTSSLAGTSTVGAANSETNGADASYTFRFTPATDNQLTRSFRFDFCDTAIGACSAVSLTNLEVETGTTITAQTSNAVAFSNSYTIDGSSDANTLNITNATGNTLQDNEQVLFTFDDIHSPDVTGTFFVRVTTYSDAAWTTAVDTGTVASSITTGISITSRVVETLGFSTRGATSTTNLGAETSSCTPLAGSGAITLGDPTEGTLSIAQAYDAWSAFRLYTNSANGTVVQYAGNSLTKGADVIDAAGGAAVASTVGSEQFGLAVDTTANGGSITNADTTFGGVGQLDLIAAYNDGGGTITNGGTASFAFVAGSTPQTIATSATNDFYVTCDTAVIRYIGNIHPTTPAGTYTTTIVYFAVPTY